MYAGNTPPILGSAWVWLIGAGVLLLDRRSLWRRPLAPPGGESASYHSAWAARPRIPVAWRYVRSRRWL